MTFHHPVQKLCVIPPNDGHQQLLLAASGSTISCIALSDGKLLHQWPSKNGDGDDSEPEQNDDRPLKRRKLESNGHNPLSRQHSEASDVSIEIVAERKKGERKKTKILDTKLPNVSHLLATSDGQHAVAVTAEDKTIRVFRIGANGKLISVSQRSLPKKLCALRLTKDEQTLLAADKFGDVYAVPLAQAQDWAPEPKPEDRTWKPSATELTVHTGRNLEALRQQKVQKIHNVKKEGLDFEHKLLLGHVSLLTDLAVGEGNVNGKSRSFILTADRDEHIRVSRGIPQAHIIETFCLGHKEFITKLCIPPTTPDLLIAGNGEVSLRVYKWQTGQLMDVVICDPLASAEPDLHDGQKGTELTVPSHGRTHDKPAVSGIWSVGLPPMVNQPDVQETLLLVAFEGVPLLFTYILTSTGLTKSVSVHLRGNVLDVVILESSRQILVSIDTVHKNYSTKTYGDENDKKNPFQLFNLHINEDSVSNGSRFTMEEAEVPFDVSNIVQALPEALQVSAEDETKGRNHEKPFSNLGEFLYGLENLRKKRGATAEDEAALEVEDGEGEGDGDGVKVE